jgi:sugar/nucleoside kinase (ribokinase family)
MIIYIGDIMVDVFRDRDGSERRHPGGKASNYAATTTALGGSAAVVGCVGTDKDGDRILHELDRAGVDVTEVQRVRNEPTGADFFEADTWRMERGANWELTGSQVRQSIEALSDRSSDIGAVVVNQGVSAEAAQAAVIAARGQNRFLVLNLGPEAVEERRRIAPEYYSEADLLVVNQIEAEFLAEQIGLDIRGWSRSDLASRLFTITSPRWALLLTGGVKGAHIAMRQGEAVALRTVSAGSRTDAEVECYIGAGDAVLAAFVTDLAQWSGRDAKPSPETVADALSRAVAVGVETLDYRGTMTASVDVPERLAAAHARV